ncbi:3724_t:CDS:2, partial [Funneliformis geosporum]
NNIDLQDPSNLIIKILTEPFLMFYKMRIKIDDPKYEFLLHNDEKKMETTPVTSSIQAKNNNVLSSSNILTDVTNPQTNHLKQIDSVEFSVNNIKSEIHSISSILCSLTKTLLPIDL